LRLCEMRLDNVVFRLGIAPTRRAARQLVTHNHITVNGENINIPSYELQVGDLVSVRERSKLLEVIATSVSANRNQMEWLEFNSETKVGKVIIAPERIQIPENIKEQVIVELYSK
jgi:small subunit ribosomal protein S4